MLPLHTVYMYVRCITLVIIITKAMLMCTPPCVYNQTYQIIKSLMLDFYFYFFGVTSGHAQFPSRKVWQINLILDDRAVVYCIYPSLSF